MLKDKVKYFSKKKECGFITFYKKVKKMLQISKEKKQNEFSTENIGERLRIKDSGIINEIYKVCYELIGKMEENRKNLDSKAGQLSNVIGVCLTIILTAILIIVPIQTDKLVLTLYVITVLLLFVAFSLAVRSMAPRTDYRTISDKDIFNLEVIKEDSNYYKRYMAHHYWCIYRNNYRINEKKGTPLKWAYRFFFIALISFFCTVIKTIF